jgi:hypothetical protein
MVDQFRAAASDRTVDSPVQVEASQIVATSPMTVRYLQESSPRLSSRDSFAGVLDDPDTSRDGLAGEDAEPMDGRRPNAQMKWRGFCNAQLCLAGDPLEVRLAHESRLLRGVAARGQRLTR